MRGMNVAPDVRQKVAKYVAATEKTTGADIKAICTEADMFALRDLRDHVMVQDFEKAINKVLSQA